MECTIEGNVFEDVEMCVDQTPDAIIEGNVLVHCEVAPDEPTGPCGG